MAPDLFHRESTLRLRDGRTLAWTEQALDVHWPVSIFPSWGHYPMMDEPEEWVRAVSDVLANPEAIPGPVRPQAG